MDIFSILKDEHHEVKQLFEEIEEACDEGRQPSQKKFHKLADSLEAHALAEEDVFYPALRNAEESRDETLEALVEHQVVKRLLAEIERQEPGTDAWWAKFKVIKEYVLHHVREEEGELFPKAKKVLEKEDRERIGQEFLAAKRQHQASSR